jgi:maltose/maltodextrin transport system permease protein
VKQADGTLRHTQTGEVLTPNPKTGFYETRAGDQLRPGFKVDVGWANYVRATTDPILTGPLLRIFGWTITFALLTVLFTVAVGMTLAVVLNWEALPGRVIYRTLLFLPYAVPGFISILVFRGLFNQNFGELNLILDHLFGIRPAWFSDPFLAKTMILIVNTWLGYPYILVLCTGLIKAIPADLYEASAMAGAGPLQNFRYVTAPLIIRPLTPLLISSFAFNFNNFVLISLLTQGRPDFVDARIPAGTTDILVSYTYRVAFQDSGQQFGLAAAISTVIFALVAGLSVINLRLTRGRVEGQPR